MVLSEFDHSSLVKGGYGLTKSLEKELNAKIDETNKVLEKAGKSILQVARF